MGQFHQHFIRSFHASRSQKRKKRKSTQAGFCTFGIFYHKSCMQTPWWNWPQMIKTRLKQIVSLTNGFVFHYQHKQLFKNVANICSHHYWVLVQSFISQNKLNVIYRGCQSGQSLWFDLILWVRFFPLSPFSTYSEVIFFRGENDEPSYPCEFTLVRVRTVLLMTHRKIESLVFYKVIESSKPKCRNLQLA